MFWRPPASRRSVTIVPAHRRAAACPAPPPTAAQLLPQFLRYGGAGAIGTAAHFGVLGALVHFAGAGAVAASTAGAIVGAIINYALNHRFTFASRRAHRVALPRFCFVAGGGILLNAAVLAAMFALVQPHYLVAQIVATGVVLVAGFLANRQWTF
jgi:putative flippase GtrA